MYLVATLLLIISEKCLCATSSLCLMHDKCITELKKFTQADEFHVYTSLEEAKTACSDAKDAYLCEQSYPECRDSSEKLKLSPLIRGSYRLLNEFCGFRAKRRPCCALRSVYLEHSSCYQEVIERLNKCNQKYRKSLGIILTVQGEDEIEKEKQRFCSVEWFGNCIQNVTQRNCGKDAAQVIKYYVMKAAEPGKINVNTNKNCHSTLYGNEEDISPCGKRNFKKCHVHLLFLQEYFVEDRLEDDEKFLSICIGLHDSLECLRQSYRRCIFSMQPKKLEALDTDEKEACTKKRNVLQRYRGKTICLARHIEKLSECQEDLSVKSINPNNYGNHLCEFLKKLEICWVNTAFLYCGDDGKNVMKAIVQMAAFNIHQGCNI